MVNSCRLNEDLLRGLCEELELFPGTSALKILDITIIVYAVDRLVSVRDEWGQLNTVLYHGFSRLLEVSIGVILRFLVQRHPIIQGIGGDLSKAISPVMGEHRCEVEFLDEIQILPA